MTCLYVYVCLGVSVFLSVCVSVCLSVCMSVCVGVCVCVCWLATREKKCSGYSKTERSCWRVVWSNPREYSVHIIHSNGQLVFTGAVNMDCRPRTSDDSSLHVFVITHHHCTFYVFITPLENVIRPSLYRSSWSLLTFCQPQHPLAVEWRLSDVSTQM